MMMTRYRVTFRGDRPERVLPREVVQMIVPTGAGVIVFVDEFTRPMWVVPLAEIADVHVTYSGPPERIAPAATPPNPDSAGVSADLEPLPSCPDCGYPLTGAFRRVWH